MPYSAVIFDLDGTLLDTLDGIVISGNKVLAAHGLPEMTRDGFGQYVGDGLRRFLEQIIPPDRLTEELIQKCGDDFRAVYRDSWHIGTRPYDGVHELLTALVDRGIRMAVLSNKVQVFAEECVRRFLGDFPFELVLGERDGVPSKPDPTGAREIIDHFAVPRDQFAYLGDTATDMRTAIAAEVLPVGALWGFRSREELIESGAQHLIASPTELLDIIGKP